MFFHLFYSITPRFLLCLSCIFLCRFDLLAQLTVKTADPLAMQRQNKALVFEVSGAWTDSVTAIISYAGKPNAKVLKTLRAPVTNGQANFQYQPDIPCVLRCIVQVGGATAQVFAAYQPYQIKPSESEPTDFDTFWAAQKSALRQIAPDIQLYLQSSTDYCNTYKISMALPDFRRAYGYICVPKGSGVFPAIIELPAFGFSSGIVRPSEQLAQQGGAIVISLNIHSNDPDQSGPNDYLSQGLMLPETNYYKYAILSVVRCVDYLETRSDYNREVGVMGVSQGGGLSLMSAGVDDRISVLATVFAAMNDHAALKYEKPAGFPYYLDFSSVSDKEQLLRAVKYYDATYAARRFKGHSLTVIGYQDDVCPPATVFAAFNALQGQKCLLHLLKNGHYPNPEEFTNPSHPNGLFAFFRTHLKAMQTPPWPWGERPLGYEINAGGQQLYFDNKEGQLIGKILVNGQGRTDLSLCWEKISGPGLVQFSAPNSLQTGVLFSEKGLYRLRLSADDISYLNSTGDRYYSLADEVAVQVGETTENPAIPVNLYPNPSTGTLYLSFPDGDVSIQSLDIWHLSGQQLSSSEFNYSSGVITLSPHLPKGIYLIQCHTNKGIQWRQFALL